MRVLALLALAGGALALPSKQEALIASSEQNMRAAEASIGAVQKDMTALATFGDEVRRTLAEEERAKEDVAHAIGYFRRQIELSSGERDVATAHIARLESEVLALQRQVSQGAEKQRACEADKATLSEANKKLLGHMSSVFQSAQAVEQGLAFKGLSGNATA
jgi:chromosome segregation ATPase